jgi:DNA-binding beta-propeller fold protein YncE
MKPFAVALAIASTLIVCSGRAEEAALLLERKIPLGEVRGRIDHLAIDLKRNRLFVAELENDTVAVIDLDSHQAVEVISGLSKPQGLGYHPATDALYVANGGDGTVAIFRGDNYGAIARIPAGEDADNIRVDAVANQLFVARHGGLVVIDPTIRRKVAEIDLKTHPEGFQLDQVNNRIFVNDPTNQAVVVVDRTAGKEVERWPTGDGGNFPMALNAKAGHVVVAFRNPARLAAYSIADGAAIANVELCGDADDVFVDAKRERVYVSCGDGHLDVFDARGNAYRRVNHLVTQLGARTSLFVPELDLLFIAARATSSERAAIWVFRPNDVTDGSRQ